MLDKIKILSVTKDDCDWDYFRCPGKGGQNVNKRNTGVRCTHRPSGAIGKSCDYRTQLENRRMAFRRMAESNEFKLWIKLAASHLDSAEKLVNHAMNPENIKIEVKENGRWVESDL